MMGKFSDVYFSTQTEIKKENIIINNRKIQYIALILSQDKKNAIHYTKKKRGD